MPPCGRDLPKRPQTYPPLQIRVRPHDFGKTRAGIDLDRLNQLVDELEVERFLGEETAR